MPACYSTMEHVSPPKNIPCISPIETTHLPHRKPLENTDLFTLCLFFFFQNVTKIEVIQYYFRLTSFTLQHGCKMHPCPCVAHSFYHWIVFYQMDSSVYLCAFLLKVSCLFPFLASIDKTAINILVQVFFFFCRHSFSISWVNTSECDGWIIWWDDV